MITELADPSLRIHLEEIRSLIKRTGGRALLVGGCVRDLLLGVQPKDLDVEVYGLEPDHLRTALAEKFQLDQVGASFGVLKLRGLPIDLSLPRRESKSGLGHKGFDIHSDPWMSPREAAARRDFTINSIALDLESGERIDPWEGARDLERRVLRHTSEHFSEDPLRVLRGMQFAARFDFAVASETVALCRTIEPEGLPRERLYDEWKKLVLKGIRPSRGLAFLRDCGWIKYYPELEALIGCEQEPDWHPEGDVWVHTLHCMDAFARERIGDDEEDLVVGFAVLCHDFGKPATTVFEDGRMRSPGHEKAGEAPTRSFLGRLTNTAELIDAVAALVLDHMRPVELYEAGASDNAVRRLAQRVKRIDRLVRVAKADQRGRPPRIVDSFPAEDWLLERARAHHIEQNAPKPIVMGRHLIDLGLTPGKAFGEILAAAYDAQLDAQFNDLEGGVRFVSDYLENRALPLSSPAMHVLEELEWRGLLADCTDPAELTKRVTAGPIVLYCGFDPTADSLHVGNLVPLLALRRFQLFGHHPIPLAGGATGSIGDPSGRTQERQLLTKELLAHNIAKVIEQLKRLLDFEIAANPARLLDNAVWTEPVSFLEFLRDIGKHFSVNQMVAKESIRARMEDRESGISYTEFSYMLLQAFDFYVLCRDHNCELQIGGSDQWGNITAGIDLTRRKLGRQVFGLTLPLITNSDGTKFGKSLGGAVYLDPAKTSVYRFYQFWIRTDDRDVIRYLKFFTFLSQEEIKSLEEQHNQNPGARVAHKALAKAATDLVHGPAATTEAMRASEILFGGELDGVAEPTFNEIVGEVPTKEIAATELQGEGKPLVELLIQAGLCPSKGQARKDIEAGGIYLNNIRETKHARSAAVGDLLFGKHLLLRKGKRNYVVLTAK